MGVMPLLDGYLREDYLRVHDLILGYSLSTGHGYLDTRYWFQDPKPNPRDFLSEREGRPRCK